MPQHDPRVGDGQVRVHAHRPGRESGFALVMSLILTTVVAGLCIGFVRMAEFTASSQSGAVDQMRAFYLAEAGLAESFNAVRMGRNGAIGSEALPASFGDGLVWVESRQADDSRVWIRSTATVGGGSATLGLIIDPEEPPLGFFADEELVIESSLVVDGFDSTERSYEAEIAAAQALNQPEPGEEGAAFELDPNSEHYAAQVSANRFSNLLGAANLIGVLDGQITEDIYPIGDPLGVMTWLLWADPINVEQLLSPLDYVDFLNSCYSMMLAWDAGALVPVDGVELTPNPVDPGGVEGSPSSGDPSEPNASGGLGQPAEESTGRGGMLGSNGNVEFLNSIGAAIFGSIMPGVEGQVFGVDPSQVSGSTMSRALEAYLPPVVLPSIEGSGQLEHAGLIPHVIGEGETGMSSLRVTNGSEVIVRGPATLIVHELVLDGGSTLSLDTRDGNVELYVTGTLDMDPASYLETTATTSTEVSISAAAKGESDPSPSLRLDAQAAFHGTVYAPDATVYIGSNFEIFGSVTARRLEIADGARLHFDDESFNGQLGVPTLESWQIIELPESVKRTKPFVAASSVAASNTNPPLAMAHDLEDVEISLRYTDQAGEAQTYAGPESALDWNDVGEIEAQERRATFDESDAESESRWGSGLSSFFEGLADWYSARNG